jgi:hypothetical protein
VTESPSSSLLIYLLDYYLLSLLLSQVLIVSTDPAHNLSDAFCQKIGREPTPIQGFDNLSAMEIDANNDMEEMQRNVSEQGTDDDGGLSAMMSELTSSIPGIDEAMSFSELMKQVQGLDFDIVVFDTAPTGHTLRLLSFPTILEKALGKIMELKDRFGGLIGQALSMTGGGNPGATQDAIVGRLEETRAVINKVNVAFQDPTVTTFVSIMGLLLITKEDDEKYFSRHSLLFAFPLLTFVYRCAFASRNFCPFTKRNAWSKNFPSSALIPTTLSSIRSCSLRRMRKRCWNGTTQTRMRCPWKLKRFVANDGTKTNARQVHWAML